MDSLADIALGLSVLGFCACAVVIKKPLAWLIVRCFGINWQVMVPDSSDCLNHPRWLENQPLAKPNNRKNNKSYWMSFFVVQPCLGIFFLVCFLCFFSRFLAVAAVTRFISQSPHS